MLRSLALLMISGAAFASSVLANSIDDSQPELSAPEMLRIDQVLARETAADELVERGPYIADPAVLAELDRAVEGANCKDVAKLAYGCFILGRASASEPLKGKFANPFNLGVADDIRNLIARDLGEFAGKGGHMDANFLTDPESRLQLVGIVNRMDRKFVPDPRSDVKWREDCGEVSLIYRFLYSVPGGSSRLPVTMNVVLPARPNSFPVTAKPCQEVARRWLKLVERSPSRSLEEKLADLADPKDGILPLINGTDVDRIELNIQAYRQPTQSDGSDFGSTAAYVIRVFRWDRTKFVKSYLTNQIDRTRLLGGAGDRNSCSDQRDPALGPGFIKYLKKPAVISSIDAGTLNIPVEYLACRAVSFSPGGPVRSGNGPFWQGAKTDRPVVPSVILKEILGEPAGRKAAMFRTVDDLRMRLNELTCTGCHQTRAIAGFHFPGMDRPGTFSANAVALAGSPHFFGDQPRRVDFLRLLASGRQPVEDDYRSGYASRPLNKYRSQLASTQLIGGWGAVCLMPGSLSSAVRPRTKREWSCNPGLRCEQQYVSDNVPGLGTCVTDGPRRVGESMQAGNVTTTSYGLDYYQRFAPTRIGPKKNGRDTRIPLGSELPVAPLLTPLLNSYYVAHQEWYEGDISAAGLTGTARASAIRDAQTGGFPGGMLRLSECQGLPEEATCGLTATNGFNNCVGSLSPGHPLSECFKRFTSYAGLRACSASSPCRDDYICLKPMGYKASNVSANYLERAAKVKGQVGYSMADGDFGQKQPGMSWAARNNGSGDQRGVCIPPYFVFQFRSDGHPMANKANASPIPR